MKCAKGKVFLKNIEPGKQFNLSGTVGILLRCNRNADVLILEIPKTNHFKSNENSYKGRHPWSAHTEVVAL